MRRGRVAPRLGMTLALTALILATSAGWSATSASGPSIAGFSYFRLDLAPLLNGRTWILQGQKLANGACRYQNVNAEMVVPPGGWEERTIALDPAGCRKLVEAGTPTDPTLIGNDGMESSSSVATLPSLPVRGASGLSPQSTRSAYIRIFWMDPANLKVNQDVTQINWTYDGSTVSNGSANGYFAWLTATGWSKLGDSTSASYGPGNSYLLGQTTSDYGNALFCPLPPIVYTHYYYVRMWGHPNGTATWAQSSDTIDECFPFHWDKITDYGPFPGF